MPPLTPDPWTILRQILYPIMGVGALVIAIGFTLRYRASKCSGDLWAGRLAGSIAIWTITATIGLWIGRASGYSAITSAIFTLGIVQLCIVVLLGAWRQWSGAWRHASPSPER